jgi:translation initiation factor 1 (eIF-1/SUI1)
VCTHFFPTTRNKLRTRKRRAIMSLFLRSMLLSPSSWMLPRCFIQAHHLPAITTALFGGQQQQSPTNNNLVTTRWKHSKRQIKRLMAPHHPAYIRKHGRPAPPEPLPPPQFTPLVEATVSLPNGWTKPLHASIARPNYPFTVARTKNKPMDAVGFLPVYSKLRKDGTKVITRIKKVTGDREAFLQEVKSVLQTSKPIRITAGGTIEIPGAHVQKVKRWLTSLGF